jgi:hypothetical protein
MSTRPWPGQRSHRPSLLAPRTAGSSRGTCDVERRIGGWCRASDRALPGHEHPKLRVERRRPERFVGSRGEWSIPREMGELGARITRPPRRRRIGEDDAFPAMNSARRPHRRVRPARERALTLREAADVFLAQPDLAASSRRSYAQTLGRLGRDLGPERPLEWVSGRELERGRGGGRHGLLTRRCRSSWACIAEVARGTITCVYLRAPIEAGVGAAVARLIASRRV